MTSLRGQKCAIKRSVQPSPDGFESLAGNDNAGDHHTVADVGSGTDADLLHGIDQSHVFPAVRSFDISCERVLNSKRVEMLVIHNGLSL
jgi:hypothetical protein